MTADRIQQLEVRVKRLQRCVFVCLILLGLLGIFGARQALRIVFYRQIEIRGKNANHKKTVLSPDGNVEVGAALKVKEYLEIGDQKSKLKLTPQDAKSIKYLKQWVNFRQSADRFVINDELLITKNGFFGSILKVQGQKGDRLCVTASFSYIPGHPALATALNPNGGSFGTYFRIVGKNNVKERTTNPFRITSGTYGWRAINTSELFEITKAGWAQFQIQFDHRDLRGGGVVNGFRMFVHRIN